MESRERSAPEAGNAIASTTRYVTRAAASDHVGLMSDSMDRATARNLANRFSALAKQHAADHGMTVPQVRRQWVVQAFLVAVFTHSPDSWVLKGGTGMMIRLPRARHSTDVDLATAMSLDEAVADLRQALAAAPSPYRWEVAHVRAMTGRGAGMQVTVTAYIGSKQIDAFKIDMVTTTRFTEAVDHVEVAADPTRMLGDMAARIAIIPLIDQVADKLCAMHEFYSGQPSNRPRDLVDLLLIQLHLTPPLRGCAAAVAAESARRGLELPAALTRAGVPLDRWASSWRGVVDDSPLAEEFRDIDYAFDTAVRCWGAVLDAHQAPTSAADVSWNPTEGRWAAG